MNFTNRAVPFVVLAIYLGFGFATPTTAQPTANRIQVKIEDQWINSNFGYKRVKVTISLKPAKPLSETVEFNVVARALGNGQDVAVVTKPIILEAGKTSVEVELYVPLSSKMSYGYNTVIHVESDGSLTFNPGQDLAMKYTSTNYYGAPPGMPTLLVVSSSVSSNMASNYVKTRRKMFRELGGDALTIDETKFPSIHELYDYYQDIQNQIGTVNKNPTAADMLQSTSIHAIAPKDVPRSWLGLSSVEIVLMSHSDLSIVAKDTQQIVALRKWIAAGGSLIVFDCGKDLENAQSARQLVDGNNSMSAERKDPWLVPGALLKGLKNFVVHEDTTGMVYYQSNTVMSNNSVSEKASQKKARSDWTTLEPGSNLGDKVRELGTQFAIFKYVLGRVTVVNDDLQNWKQDQWKLLFNASMIEGRTIRERFGDGSAEIPSTTMAIADVGQPPINGFKVLIGLFVLLVGPISYFILKKQRRLQLLFAVVPIISLMACLGLMMFAILSDGFQNRGRIRSFTAIDHSRQHAVSFSRHSHYQGIQPKAYSFGPDEAVFNSKAWSSPRSIYRQSNDGVTLNGGDIRPRMPHQFVSVNSFKTEQSLVILAGNEETTPKVRNQFDATVRLAVFTTPSGSFTIENLAPGEIATAVPLEQSEKKLNNSDVAYEFRNVLNQLSPDVRDEFLQLSAYSDHTYGYYYPKNSVTNDEKFEADLKWNQATARSLKYFVQHPGHYLAILEDYSDVTIPQENIDYKNKVHLIHGKW